MNGKRKAPNTEYDELLEVERFMETLNSQAPSSRNKAAPIQQPRHSILQVKKYEECPECDLKFEHLKDLAKHFSEVHEEDSEEDGEDDQSNIASFHNSNPKVGQGSNLPKNPHERNPQPLEGIKRNSRAFSQPNIKNLSSAQLSKVSKLTNKSTPSIHPEGIQRNKTEVEMIKDTLNQSSVKSKEITKILPRLSDQIQLNRVPTPRQNSNQTNTLARPSLQAIASAGKSNQSKPLFNSPKAAVMKPQSEGISKEKLAELYKLQIQRKIAQNVQNRSLEPRAQVIRSQEKSATVNRRAPAVSPAPSPLMSRSQISKAAPSFHFPSKRPRPLPTVPRICFVPDKLPSSIKDVGTAVVPASSTDPFLNSFFAFFHDKAPEQPPEPSQVVSTITYGRPEIRETSEDEDDDPFGDEDDEHIEEVPDTDPLLDHITSSGLPLRLRRPTLSDGNCWWDAIADQVILHDIPDIPRDHGSLRKAVANSLMTLPQTPEWIENFFENSKKNFLKFMARHRRLGTWTDNLGIMCQATALYLGRNIHIVGTANMGQEQSFTKLEAGDKADKLSPLYIGYYQDKHYQSLEYIGKPETDPVEKDATIPEETSHMTFEPPEEVIEMGDVIDLVLVRVLDEASLRSLKPKKKCKVMPIKPYKEPPKSAEELEQEKIKNEKIDSMLCVLNKRMSLKPNDDRLEIFQHLQRLDTIMEFYQVCRGGVQGVQKYSEVPGEPKAEKPTIKEVPPDAKEKEEKTPEEPTTHILDVFKCNKCNHAFEKINLFVKHFIKVHKDVIDANKNSSSFSFSNFWTKMKVRASVKKKDKEDEETKPEVRKTEEAQKSEELPKKPEKELSVIDELISLKLFKVKKSSNPPRKEKDITDLRLECESQPFIVQRRVHLNEEDEIEDETHAISISDIIHKNLNPKDFQCSVFFAEEEPSTDETISKAELEVSDKYQMIPLSEIKLENPFEDLPFTWKFDDYVPEVSKAFLSDVAEISWDDTVLGLTSEAEIVALEVLASIIHQMESILSDIYNEDDVDEMFQEKFHDESQSNISHQIYIKDFSWIPLEDQFTECPNHEKEDIDELFSIKKLRRDEDKMTSVKLLLINTENDRDAIKGYIEMILGKKFIPLEANHTEAVQAKAKYIRFDHNYLPSNKSRKLAMLRPPPNVVTTLQRIRSKVDIFPSSGQDLKKTSFAGMRPPRRIINTNLLIYPNRVNNEVKPSPNVRTLPMNRGRIQIIPQGKDTEEDKAPAQYLDKFLRRLNGEPDSPEKLAPPPFVDETAPAELEQELSKQIGPDRNSIDSEDVRSSSKTSVVDYDYPRTFAKAPVADAKVAEVNEGEVLSEPVAESSPSVTVTPSSKKKRKQESDKEWSSKKKQKSKTTRKLSILMDAKKLKLLNDSSSSHSEEIDISNIGQLENSERATAPSPSPKQGPLIISETSLMDPSASMADAWKDIDEFLDSSTIEKTSRNVLNASPVTSDNEYDSQLSDHLDSLREPLEPVVELHKAPGPPETSDSVSITDINTEEAMATDPSSYNIKQEPQELSPQVLIESQVNNVPPGPGGYRVKTELSQPYQSSSSLTNPSLVIDIKQEMDTYGLFSSVPAIPVKVETLKSEPLDSVDESGLLHEDDDDIQILDDKITGKEDISRELVDVITNVLRCKECFKSFLSKEDLDAHIKTHSGKASEVSKSVEEIDVYDANKWLTVSKAKEISSSAFPSINLRLESAKNHDYIYSQKIASKAKIAESKDDMIVVRPTKKEKIDQNEKLLVVADKKEENIDKSKTIHKRESFVEKNKTQKVVAKKAEDKVENLTVLQALDSLFQPSKSQSPNEPVVKPVQSALQALDNLLQSSKILEPKASEGKTPKPIKQPKKKSSMKAENEAMMRALIKKKEVKSSLTCQVCWKVTCATMKTMRKHLTFHPHTQCKGKVNICYICDEKFDLRDEEYMIHVESHLLEMRTSGHNQCLGCQENFSNSEQLMRHVQTVHEKEKWFPCSICQEKFDRKKKLLLHLDTIHSEVQIE